MAKKKKKPKTKNRLCVCLPDLHSPDHDEAALVWALHVVEEWDPYKIILLGDAVDFKSISRFPKRPSAALTFPEERKAARALIRELAKRFEGREVVYLIGNHEVRLDRYLWKHAPELCELGELAFTELLKVPEDWKVVPYNKVYMEQGVLVQHGRKFARSVLASNLAEFGCSSVQGHSHRLGVIHRRLPDGRVISAAEAGCLQRFDVDYAAVTNWTHGLAYIEDGHVGIHRKVS